MINDIERKNFWDIELPEYAKRAKYNKEIDEAVDRVRSGEFITHEQAMEELDLLFKNEKD
jgi:predicted transcriptional regulator